jgi:hypothetical protein
MIIQVPISVGELLDKISILSIKSQHTNNEYVRKELQDLIQIAQEHQVYDVSYVSQLLQVNRKLWNIEDDFVERELAADYGEFKQLMLDWWDKYLTVIFIKKRDIQIADSILELFRRSDFIENFNKKHLYLLVREMTDCKTHYITKVVNTMKVYQIKMLNEYLYNGTISIVPETEFWEGEYLYETEHIDEGELEYYDE